jgi:hypothetical protein
MRTILERYRSCHAFQPQKYSINQVLRFLSDERAENRGMNVYTTEIVVYTDINAMHKFTIRFIAQHRHKLGCAEKTVKIRNFSEDIPILKQLPIEASN